MARLNLAALWLSAQLATAAILARDYPSDNPLRACPGYKASNVKTSSTSLTADLKLAGPACNVYGTDLDNLVLEVTYETGNHNPVLLLIKRTDTQLTSTLRRYSSPCQDSGCGKSGLPGPLFGFAPTGCPDWRRFSQRSEVCL
jgi:hypothetical protein